MEAIAGFPEDHHPSHSEPNSNIQRIAFEHKIECHKVREHNGGVSEGLPPEPLPHHEDPVKLAEPNVERGHLRCDKA
jgi:hypothetical protein